MLSYIEDCLEIRFSQLCKLLCHFVFVAVRFFYAFIFYCCAVSEPGQQKHQSYRDEEISRSKVPAVMMMIMMMMMIIIIIIRLRLRLRLRLHILSAQLKSTFWKSHWGRIYFIQFFGKNCGLSLLLKLEVIQH